MGTRADFYVGTGQSAEWLGSVPFHGYPDGIGVAVLTAGGENSFRHAVTALLAENGDRATTPEMGWPWPWNDSSGSDFAYCFDGKAVQVYCFGHHWPDQKEPEEEDGPKAEFPDMTERKNVTFGRRSGLIVVGPAGVSG